MKEIECVLLVDDSPETNFYNKNIIRRCQKVTHICEVQNGKEALDYLNQKGKFSNDSIKIPDIIFLDINMPEMDGFEFLEKFAKFPKEQTQKTMVLLLTTSNWEKDKEKAKAQDVVYDFMEKPLTKEKFNSIINQFKTIL